MGNAIRYHLGKVTKIKSRLFIKKFIPSLLISLGLIGAFSLSTVLGASGPAVSIDQCANGGVGLTPERCATKPPLANSNYQSGNVNGAKAHWQEGEVLPYRAVLTNLNPGVNTVTFSFDTAKNSELKHAIDYLASFDTTETTGAATSTHANQNNPCADEIASCNPASPTASAAITVPSYFTTTYPSSCANGTFTGTVLSGQAIKAWTTAAGGVSAMSLSYPDGNMPTSGDCTPRFKITFTVAAGTSTVVMAWGGHIASSADWGTGNAVPTGSPYHMHAGFDQESPLGTFFQVGSQDLQLASSAIVPSQTPTVTTELHNNANEAVIPLSSSVSLGTNVHDKATVGGTSNGTPTGSVTFRFYTSSTDCTNDTGFTGGTTKGTVALVNGVAHPSTASGALAPGTYAFKAKYVSNDATKWNDATSSCEPFTVNQAQLTANTQVHDANHVNKTNSSVPLGSVMHDTAKVTGGVGGFTVPAITFTFYGNGTCNGSGTSVTNTGADEGDATAVRSAVSAALGTGSYSYKASVAGDTNYLGDDSDCEPFSVGKADLSVATELHKANEDVVSVGGSVGLGTTMHDKATVSGIVNGLAPANNVTFTFYSTNDCSDQGVAAGSIALVNGVAHPSSSEGPLAAGSYGFKASIAGDDNYNGSTGSCENFTVNQAQLTVNTQVHNSSHTNVTNTALDLGSVVHDTATVSGSVNGFDASAVSFTFYANGTCDGQGTSVTNTGDDEVAAAVRSAASNALGAGSYSYKGSTAGNSNYLGDDSDCEPFTINKTNTTVSTAIHKGDDHQTDVQGTTIPLNSSIHDQATVNGQVGSITPTGTLNYNFYKNGDCSDEPFATDTAVSLNSESTVQSNLAHGDYSFLASYSGDSNYNGSTGTCETVTVDKADTTTVTEIHKDGGHVATTTVDLGDSVHDKATIGTKVGNFNITGTVTYAFYASGDCKGDHTDQTVAVGDETSSSGSLGAGSYSYLASYSGDSNYNGSTGDCEPLTVNKADSSTVTAIHDASHNVVTSVALGTTVHDRATVSGTTFGTPTGDVNFRFYTNDKCDGDGVASGTGIALVAGVAHPSSSQGPLAAGSYSFKAHYNGDNNYNPSDGACEPLTVGKAQLGITTTIHNPAHAAVTSVALGTVVHDTASVSGQVGSITPTGAVTFQFFTSADCTSGGSSVANTGADGSDVRSADSAALAAGSYSYQATIASDDNYTGATGDCEPLTVNKAQLAVTTVAHDATHADITNGNVSLGSITHDTATITGGVSGFTVPTPTFSLTTNYSDSCANGTTVANNGTEGSATKSADSSALGAGTYAYRGSVAGNSNYLGADSSCEPFTVEKATPIVTTDIHDANHAIITTISAGATVHDSATVSGTTFGTPTGTVDFTFYTSGNCTTGGSASGTNVALTAGVADPSSSQGPLNAGNYSFKAHYDGDGNYATADGLCEPLTVTRVTPNISTTPNPASGIVGVTLNDSANLTGGLNPTGTVTFKLYSPSDPTCANTPALTNIVSVNGAGTYNTSAGFVSNATGTWRWVAVYSGDVNNNTVTSGCNDEQVTITAPVITRTLGFWQTHFDYTSSIFNSTKNDAIWTICSGGRTITSTGDLFGGFYASIPKKSNNKDKRSDLDQARMQLLQQLLAAILNHEAFGSGSTAMIDTAKAAYCGTDKAAILTQAGILDSFNNSGDSQPTSQNTGKADPSASKNAANIVTWDNLP